MTLALVGVLFGLCVSSGLSADGKPAKPAKPDRDASTILVRFASPASAAQAVAAEGDDVVGGTATGVKVVKIKAGASLDAKLAAYSARGDVVFAEPNYIAYTDALGPPTDTSYAQQWGLPKIQAVDGWSLYPGSYAASGGPKVAVVDTGVQSTHPDLQGQIDTADGANCVNASDTCAGDVALDDNGHGTHVAGILAAATNNGSGVAGTDYASQVIPVKVLGSNGSGTYAAITNGVLWAANHGARVISMSLAGASYSQTLCDAITQVLGQGILVVAAAGNNGSSAASYPAACSGTVGVAATDQNDVRASWSNTGSPDVFVSAPGVSIYSTYPTSSYATLSGTSMATPFVSGLAALLFGQVPSRSPADVKRILATTADKVGGVSYGLSDPYGTCGCSFDSGYGYGRINVYKAMSVAGAPAPPPPTVSAPTVTLSSTPASSTTSTSASFAWTTTNSPTSTTCSLDGATATSCSSPQSYSGLAAGSHNFVVSVSNSAGSASAPYSWTITAAAAPAAAPSNTALPTISGTAQPGQNLYTTNGTWTGSPTSYSYQWLRCDSAGANCTPIWGESFYGITASSADVGHTLRVAVTATNGSGSATVNTPQSAVVSSSSPAPSPPPPPPPPPSGVPANTALPTISGTARQGQNLYTTNGTWTNSPSSYSYQWLRCDSAGANCTPIWGESFYGITASSADVGHTLRVAVTASNANGSATANTPQTAVVS